MALAHHPEDQCNTKCLAVGQCYLAHVARDGYPQHPRQLLDQLLLFVLLYHKDDHRRRRRLQW